MQVNHGLKRPLIIEHYKIEDNAFVSRIKIRAEKKRASEDARQVLHCVRENTYINLALHSHSTNPPKNGG
jgi:hypothetical protein